MSFSAIKSKKLSLRVNFHQQSLLLPGFSFYFLNIIGSRNLKINIREDTALPSFLTDLEGERDENDENDSEILFNLKLNIVLG